MAELKHFPMILSYTIHDDGVWLFCPCGVSVNLGFESTPHDAMAAQTAHWYEMRDDG